jgi:hypothetical protein
MTGDRAVAGHYGAINLAHQTIQLLRDLERLRDDLDTTYTTWPRLHALVHEDRELPPLPHLTAAAAALLGIPLNPS